MKISSNKYFMTLRKNFQQYLIKHGLFNPNTGKWAIPFSPDYEGAGEALKNAEDFYYDNLASLTSVLEKSQRKTSYSNVLKVMNMKVQKTIETLTWEEVKDMPITSVARNNAARILTVNGVRSLQDLAELEEPKKAWHCGKTLYTLMEYSYSADVWKHIEMNLAILTGVRKPVADERLITLSNISNNVYNHIVFGNWRTIATDSENGIEVGSKVNLENRRGQKLTVEVTGLLPAVTVEEMIPGSEKVLLQFKVIGWE